MTGDECLVQQGFDYCRHLAAATVTEFSHTQKIDFAGNAFNGYVIGALLISLLCFTDFEEGRYAQSCLTRVEAVMDVSEAEDSVHEGSESEVAQADEIVDRDVESEDFSQHSNDHEQVEENLPIAHEQVEENLPIAQKQVEESMPIRVEESMPIRVEESQAIRVEESQAIDID